MLVGCKITVEAHIGIAIDTQETSAIAIETPAHVEECYVVKGYWAFIGVKNALVDVKTTRKLTVTEDPESTFYISSAINIKRSFNVTRGTTFSI
ncbi:hypothetical protein NDU88_001226 [Pleurodeles waltl]|uniref:Uncharacterized protein n=1 Tax=Pleurodeles waltl TaxID=8319 RepID=A0AAV7M7K4_PLEWA|nr:hypothetical protein NDU88_001226 [Pleurodeles waltl]